MKFEKINQDVLKRCVKEQDIKWTKDDDWYYILMEGNVGAWRVSKYDWYIDLDSNGPNRHNISKLDSLVKFFDENTWGSTKILRDSGEYTTIPNGKKTKAMVKIFRTADDVPVYVNPNLLAYFDEINVSYFGTDSKSPIYVLEGEYCVGVVLPINMAAHRKEV